MVRGLQLAEQQAGGGEGVVGSGGGRGVALRRVGGGGSRPGPWGGDAASRKEAASLLGGDADSEGEGEEAGKVEEEGLPQGGGLLLLPARAAECGRS